MFNISIYPIVRELILQLVELLVKFGYIVFSKLHGKFDYTMQIRKQVFHI